MRVVLLSISLVALSANLLVPQYVVRYNSCCLDENGKLIARSCGSHAPAIKQKSCCDPIVVELRNGAPAMNAATVISQLSILIAPLAVPVSAPMFSPGTVPFDVRYTTGPPLSPDLLTLHSRLNT